RGIDGSHRIRRQVLAAEGGKGGAGGSCRGEETCRLGEAAVQKRTCPARQKLVLNVLPCRLRKAGHQAAHGRRVTSPRRAIELRGGGGPALGRRRLQEGLPPLLRLLAPAGAGIMRQAISPSRRGIGAQGEAIESQCAVEPRLREIRIEGDGASRGRQGRDEIV